MLSRRLKATKSDIAELFSHGKRINSEYLSFIYIFKNKGAETKISFVVPKKVARSAVNRNLLKRRGYRVVSSVFSTLPQGIVGIFMYKPKSMVVFGRNGTKKTEAVFLLEKEINSILCKI